MEDGRKRQRESLIRQEIAICRKSKGIAEQNIYELHKRLQDVEQLRIKCKNRYISYERFMLDKAMQYQKLTTISNVAFYQASANQMLEFLNGAQMQNTMTSVASALYKIEVEIERITTEINNIKNQIGSLENTISNLLYQLQRL